MNYCIHDDTYTAQHDITKRTFNKRSSIFRHWQGKVAYIWYHVVKYVWVQFLFIPLNMQSFEPKLFEQYCKKLWQKVCLSSYSKVKSHLEKYFCFSYWSISMINSASSLFKIETIDYKCTMAFRNAWSVHNVFILKIRILIPFYWRTLSQQMVEIMKHHGKYDACWLRL